MLIGDSDSLTSVLDPKPGMAYTQTRTMKKYASFYQNPHFHCAEAMSFT